MKELKLNFEEFKDLKRIMEACPNGIYLKIEIDESPLEYCKALIEGQYKFQQGLLHKPLKIENDTLYKKLCEAKIETD